MRIRSSVVVSLVSIVVGLSFAGCGDDDRPTSVDSGPRDGGGRTDGGNRDGGAPTDGGGMMVDAGPGDVDAGGGDVDAGPGDVDAGPGDVDAGPGDVDAGPGDVDAGTPEVDAGTDAGPPPGMDAGTDAGPPPGMDAGPPASDAGFDAGPPASDAGFDAGPPAVDAGTDAGPPPGPAIFVLRIGDGAAALSSAATAAFLDGFALDGTLVTTVTLPTATTPITFNGTATSEGCLALSDDGHFLTVAGYAATPGTVGVATSMSATVPRVVARMNAALALNLTTSTSTGFDGFNVRGAVTSTGTDIWMSGNGTATTGGVQYLTLGAATSSAITASPVNMRCVGAYGGQLYATSGSGAFTALFSVGTGLPTAGGATSTVLPGMPGGGSPYGFILLDRNAAVAGVDTAYIADDRSAATGGGVQKWTFDGATWTLFTTFTIAGSTAGCRGVTAIPGLAGVTVLCTTTGATANNLVSWTDTGTAAPTATVLSTAATNTIYRGVAVAPM